MSKRRKRKAETSKRLAITILVVALIDIQLSYILAFMGRDIAESLSTTMVTTVISVYVAYCTKAFFGKKEEEKNKTKENNEDGFN